MNNHRVECDKWFYSVKEMKRHQNENGHFYVDPSSNVAAPSGGKMRNTGGKKQQPQQQKAAVNIRAHDFYEDIRAQNRRGQAPSTTQMMQQPRQQKMAAGPPARGSQQQNNQLHYEGAPGAGGYPPRRSNSAQQQRNSRPQQQVMKGGGPRQQYGKLDADYNQYAQVPQVNQQRSGGKQAQKASMNNAGGQYQQQMIQPPQYPQLGGNAAGRKGNAGAQMQQQQMPPLYECAPCQKSFQSQASLVMHVEKKHPEAGDVSPSMFNLGLRPIAEPVSQGQKMQRGGGGPTPAQQQLRQGQQPGGLRSQSQANLQQMTPQAYDAFANENPAQCNQCGKEFVRGQIALDAHQRATGHTQECACEVCGKVFADDHKLSQHIQSTGHHINNMQQPGSNQGGPASTTQNRNKKPVGNQEPKNLNLLNAPSVNQAINSAPGKNQSRQQQRATPAGVQQNTAEPRQGGRNSNSNYKNGSTASGAEQALTNQPQIFKCEVCFTSYKTFKQLTDHRKTPEHTQKVVVTAQKYAQRTNNTNSSNQQNQAQNDQQFACRMCDKSFASEQALVQHQNDKHSQ